VQGQNRQGGVCPAADGTARLTKSDLRDGVHLACQVVMRGDMQVEVDNDLMAAESFVCTVESVRALTPLIGKSSCNQPEGMTVGYRGGFFCAGHRAGVRARLCGYRCP
jgi:Na+-transporting NADH:ubiquinone oxidoreductase subunit F